MIRRIIISKSIKKFTCISYSKRISFAFIIAFFVHQAHTQTITISALLNRIDSLQQPANKYFIDGIFPSYISNKQKFKQRKPDNTIFYNALIVYTLKQYRNQLTTEQKIICDSIIAKSQRALPKFKNSERNTYNFWRTDSAFRFPYTWWIRLLRGGVTLPDDMDDTVLGLNITDVDDSTAEAVHQLMQQYINTSSHLKTTYSTYQDYQAYSTWFGKKVPVVFDVCVLTNVLAFVQQHHLAWSKADTASLQLIAASITNNDVINHPLMLSPYYGSTSIILYHLARLMSIKPVPELENLKHKLVVTALQQLSATHNELEKILLTSALMKLNYSVPDAIEPDINKIEKSDYAFFIGNIPSYFKQPYKQWLMQRDILLFYHYCPAWNDVLLLENLLLQNKVNQ